MTRLVAVRARPEQMELLLRRLWDQGDAVLPLAHDTPAAHDHGLLRTMRPDALLDATSAGGGQPEELPDPLPTADGTALVVPTSGSTGTPKGVVLSHRALAASTTASVARLGCRPGDRWLLALPVHHVAGIQVLLRAQALGTSPLLVAPGDVTAAVAVASRASDPVHVSLVPTQLARLVEAGEPLDVFATILLGGGAAPSSLLEDAAARGARVVTSYGMTESCGGCVYDGRPLDGVEVALADDGRIRIRGAVLCDGYRDPADPAPVDPDGWLTTNDLGSHDDEGRLQVLGRADDVIVSGGENLPAARIAAVLRGHPQVSDAAVGARPDPEWGEVAVAIVVPADPQHPPTLEALRQHVQVELPAAYAPRDLRLVDDLPRTPLGKVPREALDRLAATDPV